jgi:basic amino acid/polyamine antiporter, APA family
MAFWNRRRSIDAMLAPHDGPALKKTLGWPHLMLLGIGAIVGTGIYTLTGVGVEKAGPASSWPSPSSVSSAPASPWPMPNWRP